MQAIPGWFWLRNANAGDLGARTLAYSNDPSGFDTVTTEPGQVTAGPAAAETAALLLP